MNTPLSSEALDRVFIVVDLMTPKTAFLAWEQGADLNPVLAEAKTRGFDILPIKKDDRIMGVLDIKSDKSGAQQPLTDDWLISADTSVSELLDAFIHMRHPGLLVFQRQEVIGLVTPADLNKLPAKVYLYPILGRLELALAAWVRKNAGSPNEYLRCLSKGRQHGVENKLARLAKGDVQVDAVHLLYIRDLVDICVQQVSFPAVLGCSTMEEAKQKLDPLVALRNHVMHLVQPLLQKAPEDLKALRQQLATIETVLEKLEQET